MNALPPVSAAPAAGSASALLFDHPAAIILMIAPDSGVIADANPAALRYYGHAPEKLRGMPLADLEQRPPGQAAAALPLKPGRHKQMHRLAGGDVRWVELHASPMAASVAPGAPGGSPPLLCAIVIDITEYERTGAALAAARERLHIAIECARLVVWDAAVEEGTVYLSQGWSELRGDAPRPVHMTTASYMELIHPEDRGSVTRRLWETVKGLNPYYEQEYRLRTLDGRWIWLLSRGRVSERGANGRARRMSGTLMDITPGKQTQESLVLSEQRFRDVVDAAGEYVWESDPQFRLTYASDRIESMLGYTPAEVLGRRPSDFLHVGESLMSQAWYKNNVQPDGTFRGLEQCVVAKSGALVWQRITAIPVRDAQGRLTGYRGTALDITEAHEARERLEYLATRDNLTGLPNRALLADRIAQALAGAQRNDDQVALLFIDLDNFKRVNDTCGHHVGDALLRQVAARLGDAVRRADTIARLAGDEFVVLLTGVKETAAVARVAAKICTDLARPYEVPEAVAQALHTSGSVGIALYPHDGRDFTELLKSADAAMYRAKARGRNTYEFFAPPAQSSSS